MPRRAFLHTAKAIGRGVPSATDMANLFKRLSGVMS